MRRPALQALHMHCRQGPLFYCRAAVCGGRRQKETPHIATSMAMAAPSTTTTTISGVQPMRQQQLHHTNVINCFRCHLFIAILSSFDQHQHHHQYHHQQQHHHQHQHHHHQQQQQSSACIIFRASSDRSSIYAEEIHTTGVSHAHSLAPPRGPPPDAHTHAASHGHPHMGRCIAHALQAAVTCGNDQACARQMHMAILHTALGGCSRCSPPSQCSAVMCHVRAHTSAVR